jgi:hypothetical protein
MANTKIPIELSSTPSIVDNGDATAITIDSSERVGINTSSPAKKLHITDTSGNHIRVAYSDGYYWDVGRQSADGRLSFTDVTGGEILALRTGGGITFNGDTAAANALDDYEEGTWTPTDASGASLSFSTIDKNRYTKIGRFVMAHARIDYPSTSNTSTATVSLPVTPSTDCIASVTGGVVVEQNYDSSVTLTAAVDGTNGARFRINGVGALQNQNLSGKSVRFTVIYISA